MVRPIVRTLLFVAAAALWGPAVSQTRPPVTRGAALAVPARGGVDWQAAVGGLRQSGNAAPATVRGLDQAAIDRTAVPILLPTGAGFAGTPRIYSFGDYYSLTGDLAGAGVSLTGTTATVALPVNSRLTLPDDAAEQLVVQRTVDGQLASFVRYGVLYTVEIRCDDPKDVRCRSEGAVRDLVARTTIVVMGKAARQAAGLGG